MMLPVAMVVSVCAEAASVLRTGGVDRGYIHKHGSKHAELSEYSVNFAQGKRALALVARGFDIDSADEVQVLVDDQPLGYLRVSKNRGYRTSDFDIPLDGIGTIRKLTFRPKNPKWVWGVARIALVEQLHPLVRLRTGKVDRGRYGYRYGNRHVLRGVRFKFAGAEVEQILKLRGYDIDKSDDVSVFVNGTKLGDLRVTGNRKHRLSEFSVPASLQSAKNIVELRSNKGPNQWGVKDVVVKPVFQRNDGIQSNTGQSNTDQSNTGQSNTGQSNTPTQTDNSSDQSDDANVVVQNSGTTQHQGGYQSGSNVTEGTTDNAAATTEAPDYADAVIAHPGDDLPALARNAAEHATIIIKAGLHRSRRIVPRNGQTFRCEDGAIISGAHRLNGTWYNENGLWVLNGVDNPHWWVSGEMKPGREINRYREDLFISNRLYLRVDAKHKVTAEPTTFYGKELYAGTFYQEGDRLYVATDPRNQLVEMSKELYAIRGPHPDHYAQEIWNPENQGLAYAADDVTIENCIFEKYATHAQLGAVEAAFTKNWKLINVTARYNHGGGLRTGKNTKVIGGSYSHNGHIGIHGSTGPCTDQGYEAFGGNLSVDGAEIAYNNWAGYYVPWEAGGIKVLEMNNFSIKNSHVHHNFGKGIWTDTDVYGITIESNDVHHNSSIGINLESSYGRKRDGSGVGTVRNNKIRRNAVRADDSLDWIWYWGAAVLVQNSRDFDISQNTVEVDLGQGIAVVNQGYGDRLCDRTFRPAVNNRVFGNTTRFTNRAAPVSDPNGWFHHKTGVESDYQALNGTIYSGCEQGFTAIDATAPSANNKMFDNVYEYQSSAGQRHWRFDSEIYRWDQLPSAWEQGSTFNGRPR